jgi:hypothetical protein
MLRVDKANKRKLRAAIYDRLGRGYLETQARGGIKRPTGQWISIPTHHIKRTASGKIGKAKRPRNIVNKPNVFFRHQGPTPDIVRKPRGKGKQLEVLYQLVPLARIPKRLRFYEDAIKVVQRRAGGPRFVNMAGSAGVVASRPYAGGDQDKVSTAWHAQFADLNNDGLVDLFIAKGNVDEMEEGAIEDPNNLLLRQRDGSFRETGLSAGVGNMERSRGATLVDLDLDGRLDIVVVNRRANAEILHNRSDESGHWLQVALRQDGGNVNAIGAWTEVRAEDQIWRQEVVIGGGHASGQSGWHHFGLGGERDAEIRVQWPDGGWSGWQAVGSNRFVTVKRDGRGIWAEFGHDSAL